jgi:hypothetical protein
MAVALSQRGFRKRHDRLTQSAAKEDKAELEVR